MIKKGGIFDFQNVKTVQSFGRDMMNGNIALNDAQKKQIKQSKNKNIR